MGGRTPETMKEHRMEQQSSWEHNPTSASMRKDLEELEERHKEAQGAFQRELLQGRDPGDETDRIVPGSAAAGYDPPTREPGESDFVVKDSGRREEFASGMRRDIEDGKTDYTLAFDGPLVSRVAEHLTKGAAKYGARNWQLASSLEEAERFRRSALRHLMQWLDGELDEDHFSAVIFNMNAHEYVLQKAGYRRVQDWQAEHSG